MLNWGSLRLVDLFQVDEDDIFLIVNPIKSNVVNELAGIYLIAA